MELDDVDPDDEDYDEADDDQYNLLRAFRSLDVERFWKGEEDFEELAQLSNLGVNIFFRHVRDLDFLADVPLSSTAALPKEVFDSLSNRA